MEHGAFSGHISPIADALRMPYSHSQTWRNGEVGYDLEAEKRKKLAKHNDIQ